MTIADIFALEKQIDEMVYTLYGPAYRSGRLTPEEIAIVAGKDENTRTVI